MIFHSCQVSLLFPLKEKDVVLTQYYQLLGSVRSYLFLVTIDVTFAFTPNFILSHRGGWIVDQIFRSGHICLVKADVLLSFPLTLKLFSHLPCLPAKKYENIEVRFWGDENFTIVFSLPS